MKKKENTQKSECILINKDKKNEKYIRRIKKNDEDIR